MCDVDGCRGTAYRRRSRKRRWCAACCERIDPGDEYVRQLIWADDAQLTIQCLRCAALFQALLKAARWDEAISTTLDCGEYIDDEDHPLQWLAFALPSDRAVSEAVR